MTNTHRDTVMRLLVEVGNGCAAIMDQEMRDLNCRRVQVDEIWAYVQKKQRMVTREDDRRRVGDMWTFVVLDPDTKVVPAYRVGKRTLQEEGGLNSHRCDGIPSKCLMVCALDSRRGDGGRAGFRAPSPNCPRIGAPRDRWSLPNPQSSVGFLMRL